MFTQALNVLDFIPDATSKIFFKPTLIIIAITVTVNDTYMYTKIALNKRNFKNVSLWFAAI